MINIQLSKMSHQYNIHINDIYIIFVRKSPRIAPTGVILDTN